MIFVYQPAEDSFLLCRVLEEKIPNLLKINPNLKLLEIGSGSGIILETAKKLGVKIFNIYAVDINNNAVKHCNNLGFNCIYSDLFENVKGRYDLIIFNPPYLPEDKREPKNSRLATTGGKKGSEIINKFLEKTKKYLTYNGIIILLTSSLTKEIIWRGYKRKLLDKEKLFMEEIYVWELTKK